MKVAFSILFLLIVSFQISVCQNDIPYTEYSYAYIRYDKNRIDFPGDSVAFEHLFSKFDKLILRGEGKVNVVHFGGSHIQAGIYSGRTRERLQTFYPGLNGGRGMVFPYRMARSNAPNNYNITWTGDWQTCTNVQYRRTCSLGMLGISAYTNSVGAELRFVSGRKYLPYDINKIRVFHEFGEHCMKILQDSTKSGFTVTEFPAKGYTLIESKNYLDTVRLQLVRTDSQQTEFTFYGMSVDNDDAGIVYHDAGINGASFPSFLKCNLLESQMAEIQPDLVIISLGTNDTYTKSFDPEFYRSNYIEFIRRIRKASPNAAILMTVPNDVYFRRRYPNKNVSEAETVIYDVARTYNCGVWNFYQIMGGFNSSILWQKDMLMVKDRVHFSAPGYLIKGDLLFEAILRAYDKHLEARADTAYKHP